MLAAMEEYFSDKNVDVHYFLGTETMSFSRDLTDVQAQFDYQYLSIYDYEKFENFDFLILAYGNMNIASGIDNKIKYLERFAHVPCAVLQDETRPVKGFNVISDNYGGMKQIVDHLIEFHEFSDILLLCGPEHNEDSIQRRQAYLESMISHGCPVSDTMIRYGDYTENVDDLVEELLKENESPEAIVCANDEMASAVYRVCEKRGLKVGTDIAVTGFDDIPIASFLDPPLTTVRQESHELGEMAAKLALQYLEGEEVPAITRIPVSVIFRNSCGCTTAADKMELAASKDSVGGVVDDSRKVWNHALMGPIVTRELVSVSDNIQRFFSRMAEHLIDMGARSSALLVQKDTMINTVESGYQMADELYLVFEQRGVEYRVYDRADSPCVHLGEGLIQRGSEGDPARQYFSYLIFDGERQYGILIVEIDARDIPYFYLASLHFGTAFHFHEINNHVIAERTTLIQQNAKLNYSANSDPLTGLLNRRGVENLIMTTIHENEGRRACVMIGDLDHLKEINDTFGHGEGDFAIKASSEVLRRVIGDHAPLGRIGGDEFAIFLRGEDYTLREQLVERLHKAALSNRDSHEGPVIAIGLAEYDPLNDTDVNDIFDRADHRMYEDKRELKQGAH